MVNVTDVAQHAKVSTATVSRVLNGSPTVAPKTKERVLESARILGFQPNSFARSLRQGHGRSVALVTGDIEHGIYPALAKHAQRELETLGLDLHLYNLDHQQDRMRHLLENVVSLGLRGILLASADTTNIESLLPHFRNTIERDVTVLAVSQRLDSYGIPSIVHDDREGAEKAVRHLIQRGRRSIAFLGRIKASAVGTERYNGYARALRDAGHTIDPNRVWDISDGYRSEAGYKMLINVLDRDVPFDAILTASDEQAIGAMAALKDRGRKVPDDISIVGFGGIEWGRFVRPSLSSVALDAITMASSIRQFFECIKTETPRDLLTFIPPSLIIRNSS